MNTDVLIIGAGLSGVYTAYLLRRSGVDFILAEARDRLGGRILSTVTDSAIRSEYQPAVDMGPSWFWPDQSRISGLVRHLSLESQVYPQSSRGNSVMEYPDGTLQQGFGSASMAGSLRLAGGMQTLVSTLANDIPPSRIRLRSRISHIHRDSSGLHSTAQCDGEDCTLVSQRIVLALPPRIVADTIEFSPGFAADFTDKLRTVPTWMAGQAKFAAYYKDAFWRMRGLSGDAMSQLGPMVEIHDASPVEGGPYALFGFVGVGPAQRMGKASQIERACIEQIARLFGPAGLQPLGVAFKDWAFDNLTATELDISQTRGHPVPGVLEDSEWNSKLLWAGSETSVVGGHCNGYLEGALESAERVAGYLAVS